jgi:hypothetical protein
MKTTIMLGIIPLLVIAPTLAYATNEGSYKLGYNTAFNAYKCVYTDDCDMVGSQSPVYDLCALGVHSTIEKPTVTNTTACSDGYVNGWKAWCSSNVKDCLDDVLNGNFPIRLTKSKPLFLMISKTIST